MDLFLQLWAGGCYLANKILFALAEQKRGQQKRTTKIIGWLVYILGVPAWVIILVANNDWIAASIEAGGLPAMLLGLYNTFHNYQKSLLGFNRVVALSTYGSLFFGVGYSLYHYGGFSSLTQLLEVGVMVGFLLGSYYLAKNNASGWLFFMVMNISMASLMWVQQKPLLVIQQFVSLGFVVYGFMAARKAVRGDMA